MWSFKRWSKIELSPHVFSLEWPFECLWECIDSTFQQKSLAVTDCGTSARKNWGDKGCLVMTNLPPCLSLTAGNSDYHQCGGGHHTDFRDGVLLLLLPAAPKKQVAPWHGPNGGRATREAGACRRAPIWAEDAYGRRTAQVRPCQRRRTLHKVWPLRSSIAACQPGPYWKRKRGLIYETSGLTDCESKTALC